jgi:hypothetical protein
LACTAAALGRRFEDNLGDMLRLADAIAGPSGDNYAPNYPFGRGTRYWHNSKAPFRTKTSGIKDLIPDPTTAGQTAVALWCALRRQPPHFR